MEIVIGLRVEGDKELPSATIARAREGDATARRELVRGYYDLVYRHVLVAAARAGSQSDAEDITQSTFVRVFESLDTYGGEGSFTGWLLTIAMRTASDFYRRRGTVPSIARPPNEVDAHDASDFQTPLDDVLIREARLDVQRALAQLSLEHRQVLACRVVSELDVKETARIMMRSGPAVKMLQLRAVRALASALLLDARSEAERGSNEPRPR